MTTNPKPTQSFQAVDTKAGLFLLPGLYAAFYLVRLTWANVHFVLAGHGLVFDIAGVITAVLFLGLALLILRQNPLRASYEPAKELVTCWRGVLGRTEVVEAASTGVTAVTLRQDQRQRGRNVRLVTILTLAGDPDGTELMLDPRHDQVRVLADQLAAALGVPVEDHPPAA